MIFLALDCVEAFYGGAAGGGKSNALLMAALMYVHVPGYAALILRRDTQRLRLAGGLIPRSHAWLADRAQWNDQEQCWLFETAGAPASLRFGYLQTPLDRHRYQSSEYQFIGFDELTEFEEEDYLYLFSRLRRLRDQTIPLRMRAASNPGNLGHAWVKRRFVGRAVAMPPSSAYEVGECGGAGDQGTFAEVLATSPVPPHPLSPPPPPVLWLGDRAYVPAQLADNPALDAATYRQNLLHLAPVLREQLLHGDWSVREEGLIKPHWIREYSLVEGQYELHRPVVNSLAGCERQRPEHGAADYGAIATIPEAACRRFVTIDPAGTSADRAKEVRGRERSWTVMQIWDQPRGALHEHLILRHQWRGQVGFDRLLNQLRVVNREWRPARMHIEQEKLGQAAVDALAGELPLETIRTGGSDKVTRAAPLLVKLERGEIWLPRGNAGFRQELEAEWFAWSGHPDEPSDQIDAAAYAAQLAERGGVIRLA